MKALSKVNDILLSFKIIDDHLRILWEREIKKNLSKSQWEHINVVGAKISLYVVVRETRYEMIHCWYITQQASLQLCSQMETIIVGRAHTLRLPTLMFGVIVRK